MLIIRTRSALVLLAIGMVAAETYAQADEPLLAPLSAATTAERLARGSYLCNHQLRCIGCHSQRAWALFSGPRSKDSPPGAGGQCLGEEYGVPGRVCPPNITPDPDTGLGGWSDAEIIRVLRTGVTNDGRRILFRQMFHAGYERIPDEDIEAIVTYLRSLRAVKSAVPESYAHILARVMLKWRHHRARTGEPVPTDTRDVVAYGAYLATVAGCRFCHTPVDRYLEPITGMDFHGGHEHRGPWGLAVSPNLTPHESGIKDMTEKNFMSRFSAFRLVKPARVRAGGPNTVMPWRDFAGLNETDLAAIYAYLRSLEPFDNLVEKWPLIADQGRR